MQRFILAIALLACLPVFAQDQSARVPRNDFTIYHVRGSYHIIGFEDQLSVTSTNLEGITHTLCLLRLTGNVEVTTKGVALQADEADYHCGTGEIEPRGNVVLKPFVQ
jgi:lipopolysaccharide assembly outer membrane protein LptD (OstA)